jgi:hypothetical protein
LTPHQLLETLAHLNITLAVIDGRLRASAEKGLLTAELSEQIRTHKDGLIDLLQGGRAKPAAPSNEFTKKSAPKSQEKLRKTLTIKRMHDALK